MHNWEIFGTNPTSLNYTQRLIAESESQQRAVQLAIAQSSDEQNWITVRCAQCTKPAAKLWKDLGKMPLCKSCRTNEELIHHKKKLDKIPMNKRKMCHTCGTPVAQW